MTGISQKYGEMTNIEKNYKKCTFLHIFSLIGTENEEFNHVISYVGSLSIEKDDVAKELTERNKASLDQTMSTYKPKLFSCEILWEIFLSSISFEESPGWAS